MRQMRNGQRKKNANSNYTFIAVKLNSPHYRIHPSGSHLRVRIHIFSFKEGELDTFDQIGTAINENLQVFAAYVWVVQHSSTCYKQIG